MTGFIEITPFGGKLTIHKLDEVLDRVGNLRPAYMAAWALFRRFEQEQFAGQGVGPHGAWADLNPNTAARKARLGLDSRILMATLGLRNSLTRRGSKFGTFRMSRDGARWGTRHPAAGFHTTGTRNMPARPPVDLTREQRHALVAEVRNFMLEPLG